MFPLFDKGKTIFNIVGFDVETYGNENTFYMGGLYEEGEEFKAFYNKHDMIDAILSKEYHNKIIVATNLGFDFNALFFGTPYWSKFETIYSGGRFLSAIYESQEKDSKNQDYFKIMFLDTSNYLPISVEKMGKILKIPKLEHPKFLGQKPTTAEEEYELLVYNERDCEISCKFLMLIQKVMNSLGGQLKITIASCAMDIYRRKYHKFIMKHETTVLKDDNYYEFIFDAYFGGRTEPFHRGTLYNAKVYDINSLYPAVMRRSFPLPMSVRKVPSPNDSIDYCLRFEGVSKVRIKTPKFMKYPYLPKKHKVKGSTKLLFPLGTWIGTYTHFELRRALTLGYEIVEMFESYIYKRTFYPFNDYVNDLYSLRRKYQREKSPFELGVKLLLNSLYGKFGQRKVNEIQFLDLYEMNEEQVDDFMKNPNRKINMSNDHLGIETTEKDCESSFVFPIFPTYVTAYARDLLYDYIIKYNAVYCDTDSITTYQTMEESTELGGMKIEYDVVSGIIIKPKLYMFIPPEGKPIVKMKGVPIRTQKGFEQILRGERIEYKKFTKTKESLRRGLKPNTIIDAHKKVDLEDTKRVWKGKFDLSVFEESTPQIIDE